MVASVRRSTLALVMTRSFGVAARHLSLLSLATLLSPIEFAACGLAFALSEFARCFTDAGVDTTLLRKGENASPNCRHSLIYAATSIKVWHGLAISILLILFIWIQGKSVTILIMLIGLQFLPQALLQLTLNTRQIDDTAHTVLRPIAVFYILVIAFASQGFFGSSSSKWALPILSLGELLFALTIGSRPALPSFQKIHSIYTQYFPTSLPMLGVALLALINTRVDSLIVSGLLPPNEAAEYMFFMRWSDIAPMFAAGVCMPLVGKIDKLNNQTLRKSVQWALFSILLLAPLATIQLALVTTSNFDSKGSLPWIFSLLGAVRIGLSISTVLLLSQWRDGDIFRIAVCTSITITLGSIFACRTWGSIGIAAVVLSVEAMNFAYQTRLLYLQSLKTRPIKS